jgi:transcriptional regulator with XRE-family HTH domain
MWERQFGERINHIRTERNLTKAEFGKLVGVTERYVGNIENGNHAITGATIVRICGKTGVSADYAMFGAYNTLTALSSAIGITREETQMSLDIVMRVVNYLNTPTANYTLLQEVMRQYQPPFEVPQI